MKAVRLSQRSRTLAGRVQSGGQPPPRSGVPGAAVVGRRAQRIEVCIERGHSFRVHVVCYGVTTLMPRTFSAVVF